MADDKLNELAEMTRRRIRTVDGERRIVGRRGHISGEPEGLYLFLAMHSPEGTQLARTPKEFAGCTRKLMHAVQRLQPQAEVIQLAEDEAMLIVREDPGKQWWVDVAMPELKCFPIRELSEAQRERLKTIGFKSSAS